MSLLFSVIGVGDSNGFRAFAGFASHSRNIGMASASPVADADRLCRQGWRDVVADAAVAGGEDARAQAAHARRRARARIALLNSCLTMEGTPKAIAAPVSRISGRHLMSWPSMRAEARRAAERMALAARFAAESPPPDGARRCLQSAGGDGAGRPFTMRRSCRARPAPEATACSCRARPACRRRSDHCPECGRRGGGGANHAAPTGRPVPCAARA